jgi:hypothetical protein
LEKKKIFGLGQRLGLKPEIFFPIKTQPTPKRGRELSLCELNSLGFYWCLTAGPYLLPTTGRQAVSIFLWPQAKAHSK